MKDNYIRRSRLLDKITVDSEYAQAHFEELMNRVCRENIAIIVRDGKGSVVMVPRWWYHLYFNKSAESGGLFLLTDNDSGEK